MLWNTIQRDFSRFSPLTQEFVQLLDGTLRYGREVHDAFVLQLAQQPASTSLEALVEGELRPRLFNEVYCTRIQPFLTAIRRALLRLENVDLHEQAKRSGNDLHALASIGDKVEALFQKYWEYYRYHKTLSHGEVVGLLIEVNALANTWQLYFTGFRHMATLFQKHSLPENRSCIHIGIQLPQSSPPTTQHVQALLRLVECLHQWIGQAHGQKTLSPPTLCQMETHPMIAVELGVQPPWHTLCQRVLQHLFLKDVLGQEPLVKVLLETAWCDAHGTKPSPAVLSKATKQMNQCLKALPTQATFQVDALQFPQDSAKVLKDLLRFLAERNISGDSLLRVTRSNKKLRTNSPQTSLVHTPSMAKGGDAVPPSPNAPSQTSVDFPSAENHEKNAIGVLTGSL